LNDVQIWKVADQFAINPVLHFTVVLSGYRSHHQLVTYTLLRCGRKFGIGWKSGIGWDMPAIP